MSAHGAGARVPPLIGRAAIAQFSVVLVALQRDPGQQSASSGMAMRASHHTKSRQLQGPAIASGVPSAGDWAQPESRKVNSFICDSSFNADIN